MRLVNNMKICKNTICHAQISNKKVMLTSADVNIQLTMEGQWHVSSVLLAPKGSLEQLPTSKTGWKISQLCRRILQLLISCISILKDKWWKVGKEVTMRKKLAYIFLYDSKYVCVSFHPMLLKLFIPAISLRCRAQSKAEMWQGYFPLHSLFFFFFFFFFYKSSFVNTHGTKLIQAWRLSDRAEGNREGLVNYLGTDGSQSAIRFVRTHNEEALIWRKSYEGLFQLLCVLNPGTRCIQNRLRRSHHLSFCYFPSLFPSNDSDDESWWAKLFTCLRLKSAPAAFFKAQRFLAALIDYHLSWNTTLFFHSIIDRLVQITPGLASRLRWRGLTDWE